MSESIQTPGLGEQSAGQVAVPIEMILFDYGNVIEKVDHSRFLKSLQKETGVPWMDLKQPVFGREGLCLQMESGTLDWGSFIGELSTLVGRKLDSAVVSEMFCDIFTPVPEMKTLIRDLRGKVRLGLLSNTSQQHVRGYLEKDPVYPLFDQRTLSFEVGAMKPTDRIFLDAIHKFDGSPDRILYLDDIPEFVSAARSHGIRAFEVMDPAVAAANVRGLVLGTGP